MLAGTANRLANGEELPDPTAPVGRETLDQPLQLVRIHQYLSMATPLLWSRQADTSGVLGLILGVCAERNGYAETVDGIALIRDTDGGRLDGDRVYDRAVGPMQFIPSTWAGWGVDANQDGVKDPFNIFDAAAAAADYLCAAGRNLRTYAGQQRAVRSYNNSDSYISMVLRLEREYAAGVVTVPVPPVQPRTTRPPHRPSRCPSAARRSPGRSPSGSRCGRSAPSRRIPPRSGSARRAGGGPRPRPGR